MKGSAKEHIGIAHRHSQQCGDGQKEEVEEGAGWAKVGEWGHL